MAIEDVDGHTFDKSAWNFDIACFSNQHSIYLSSDFECVIVLFADFHLCIAAVSAVFCPVFLKTLVSVDYDLAGRHFLKR